MFNNKVNISIYITDDKIGFYQYDVPKNHIAKYGYIDLDKGIIQAGDILEPEILYRKLQGLLKQNKIKPSVIRYVINDQSVIKKEIIISKEELAKMSIEQYVVKQLGKTIHFPFENPVFTHYIREEKDNFLKVLIVISDGEMLNNYHDIFDRLKAKEVILDLPSLSLYNSYLTKTQKSFKNLMLVSLYDRIITIKIVEDDVPIFSITEETEDSSQQYYDVLENYVERIINFYRFNMNKGEKTIENIVFFNFSEDITSKSLKEKITVKFKEHTYDLCEIMAMDESLATVPKICLMGYAAGIPKLDKLKIYKTFGFNLNRSHPINQVLHYIMAMSFLILSSMILIYIPYYLKNEEIVNQVNINSILQNQLEILQRETPVEKTYTTLEKNYSNSYDFLIDKEYFASVQLSYLLNLIPEDAVLMSYQVQAQTKTITIVISSLNEFALNEYLLDIYEEHGVITTATEVRFMTGRPVTRMISPLIMEVKITYA